LSAPSQIGHRSRRLRSDNAADRCCCWPRLRTLR
jgi:hypothetical protein